MRCYRYIFVRAISIIAQKQIVLHMYTLQRYTTLAMGLSGFKGHGHLKVNIQKIYSVSNNNTHILFVCVSEDGMATKLYFPLIISNTICINPKWLPKCAKLITFTGGFTYGFHININKVIVLNLLIQNVYSYYLYNYYNFFA